MMVYGSSACCPSLTQRAPQLLEFGAVVLDVDDTILARDSASQSGETFAESPAAAFIPELLEAGVRIVLVTGHGWRQLESRLVGPIQSVLQAGATLRVFDPRERLEVYANRGATKITWDGCSYRTDEEYSNTHGIPKHDCLVILGILEDARAGYHEELRARATWYRRTFPRFDGWRSAAIEVRERSAIALRPIPSAFHALEEIDADPRVSLACRVNHELRGAGLDRAYEAKAEGRTSVVVYSRGVSKEFALTDVIQRLSGYCGRTTSEIEHALVYIGDEFYPGGNDEVVSLAFPGCLCFSVSQNAQTVNRLDTVVSTQSLFGEWGTAATRRVLASIASIARTCE